MAGGPVGHSFAVGCVEQLPQPTFVLPETVSNSRGTFVPPQLICKYLDKKKNQLL